MSIKLKLAAVAAIAALATPAFAVTDFAVDGNAVGADVNALSVAEFAAIGTLAGDGNVAFVNQESANNMAYVDQSGATNYASVVQTTNDVNLAVVYQIGDANRAAVFQH